MDEAGESPPRSIVVVDVETSALKPNAELTKGMFGQPVGTYGVVVEAAWWNLTTDENGSFVPSHTVAHVRSHGELQALVVSRYLERLAEAEQDKGPATTSLHNQLDGATLAGSNPSFDAMFLRSLFESRRYRPEPWHHRLLDVSAYAAGKLGITGDHLPGLAKVCRVLGVSEPDHTAAGDVLATGECLLALGAVPGKGAAA